MQVFNRNVSVRGLTVFGFEIVLISGSMALAASLHGGFSNPAAGAILWKIAAVTALCELCFYYNDLYDLTVVHSNRELVVRLLQAAGAATIVLAAACLAFPTLLLDPSTFVTALGVFVVAVLTWRVAFNHFAHDPHLEERILIVGTGQTARILAQQIGRQQDFAYRLVGFVDESEDATLVRQHDILGTAADIDRILANSTSVGRVARAVTGWDHLRQQGVPVTRPVGIQLVSRAAGALDQPGSVGFHRVQISIACTHGMEGNLAPVRRPGRAVCAARIGSELNRFSPSRRHLVNLPGTAPVRIENQPSAIPGNIDRLDRLVARRHRPSARDRYGPPGRNRDGPDVGERAKARIRESSPVGGETDRVGVRSGGEPLRLAGRRARCIETDAVDVSTAAPIRDPEQVPPVRGPLGAVVQMLVGGHLNGGLAVHGQYPDG